MEVDWLFLLATWQAAAVIKTLGGFGLEDEGAVDAVGRMSGGFGIPIADNLWNQLGAVFPFRI
jgi:hypothetical protein